ncbi:MAG: hypothetical protein RJB22_83 [Pseudomonadota bacterium]|jgi:hypothetical protein
MSDYFGQAMAVDHRLARATDPVVKVRDIACVTFERPDLQKAVDFLADFGLSRPVFDGGCVRLHAEAGSGPCCVIRQGPKPRFIGPSLVVATRADLDRLAAQPGASPVQPARDWPEADEVCLTDPAGFEVRVLWGPQPDTPAVRAQLAQNARAATLRLNEGQRPPLRPSTVLKLGHAVMGVVDFFSTARWYMDMFGLIASDIQTIGDGEPALAFLRCDRGDDPADHHSIVIAQNADNLFSHAAFEVIDLDDIAMGQEYLLSRGHRHAWGVGRHLLGSQIFDYWRDPWGDKFEHFCDSDRFTADCPTGVSPLTSGGLYQWGPEPPADFESPKITPRFIWRALRNIRNSTELTFARMAQLKRAIDAPARPWTRKD